jgi:phospholipid transport system substrate-binding protein
MMSSLRWVRAAVAIGLAVGVGLAARPARADDAIEKPINVLVKSVRYNKGDIALKQLDGETQGKVLLGAEWAKGMPGQRAEFVSLFHQLFAGLAFPKIQSNLQNLSTILYEKPVTTGDKSTIVSTIVIDHPLKKEEMKVQYDLHKTKDGWKVVDVVVLGVGSKSMLTTVKDQIDHLYKEGGWDNLLKKMRERAASLKK